MQEVSFWDVRNAVAAALGRAFPSVPVQDGSKSSNAGDAEAPYFTIRFTEGSHIREQGRRFRRSHSLAIRYKAAAAAPESELYQVAERLTEALQDIVLGGAAVAAQEMRFAAADGELSFAVQYQFMVWAPAPDHPAMQTLDVLGGMKH